MEKLEELYKKRNAIQDKIDDIICVKQTKREIKDHPPIN